MILACSEIAINCNFTARIISLLYIHPQFTYELLHILHVMYLHIWRGQTTFTFHGLYNGKSSHRLQLWKRFLLGSMQSFPKHIIHWETKRQMKDCLTCPAQPTAVSGLFLLMIIPLETLHAFHSLSTFHKFTPIVPVHEKLAREAFLLDMRSQSWTSRHE